jgi:hypothetical protein
MVLYHNAPRTLQSTILMTDEIWAMAASISSLGLSPGQVKDRVVTLVEDELQGRYGFAEGRKLYAEFARTFAETTKPTIVHGKVTA